MRSEGPTSFQITAQAVAEAAGDLAEAQGHGALRGFACAAALTAVELKEAKDLPQRVAEAEARKAGVEGFGEGLKRFEEGFRGVFQGFSWVFRGFRWV